MNFLNYLTEHTIPSDLLTIDDIKAAALSREVDMHVYIKSNNIYIRSDNKMAIHGYHQYSYHENLQMLKDFVTKHYMPDYDLAERIPLLLHTIDHDKETDLYIKRAGRVYQHKPIICAVTNIDDHNYIIGYHHTDINKAAEYMGLPKEGHTLYILDGKFKAAKTHLANGITAYVLSPSYQIRKADGNTEVVIAGQTLDIKHIRREI